MAEGATRTEHATEDRALPAASAPDEADETAAARRRARQMALAEGIVRDYEPVLRELARR